MDHAIASSLAATVAAQYRYLSIQFGDRVHELVIPLRSSTNLDEDQVLIEVDHPTSRDRADRIPVLGISCVDGDIEVIVWDRHGEARQVWHERSDS